MSESVEIKPSEVLKSILTSPHMRRIVAESKARMIKGIAEDMKKQLFGDVR